MIIFEATLDRASRRKDKSISVACSSNFEMSTDDYAAIDRLMGSTGYFVYAENPTDIEVPSEPARDGETKPKGQRMRSVFFLIWKKRGIEEPFSYWRDRQFEKILDKYKEELD